MDSSYFGNSMQNKKPNLFDTLNAVPLFNNSSFKPLNLNNSSLSRLSNSNGQKGQQPLKSAFTFAVKKAKEKEIDPSEVPDSIKQQVAQQTQQTQQSARINYTMGFKKAKEIFHEIPPELVKQQKNDNKTGQKQDQNPMNQTHLQSIINCSGYSNYSMLPPFNFQNNNVLTRSQIQKFEIFQTDASQRSMGGMDGFYPPDFGSIKPGQQIKQNLFNPMRNLNGTLTRSRCQRQEQQVVQPPLPLNQNSKAIKKPRKTPQSDKGRKRGGTLDLIIYNIFKIEELKKKCKEIQKAIKKKYNKDLNDFLQEKEFVDIKVKTIYDYYQRIRECLQYKYEFDKAPLKNQNIEGCRKFLKDQGILGKPKGKKQKYDDTYEKMFYKQFSSQFLADVKKQVDKDYKQIKDMIEKD